MSLSRLQQIIRLREMLRKWRRLAQKARSLSTTSSTTLSSAATRTGTAGAARVPPGHLAVYVGQERVRFVIRTSLLTHPLFKALLKKTEEEIGFQYEGGLTIPCEASSFQHLLLLMQSKHDAHNMMLMMMMHVHVQDDVHEYHHAHGHEDVHVHGYHHAHEHDDVQVHVNDNVQEFHHLLRELLQLHLSDNSGRKTNCCFSRGLPLTTNCLPQPVFG